MDDAVKIDSEVEVTIGESAWVRSKITVDLREHRLGEPEADETFVLRRRFRMPARIAAQPAMRENEILLHAEGYLRATFNLVNSEKTRRGHRAQR